MPYVQFAPTVTTKRESQALKNLFAKAADKVKTNVTRRLREAWLETLLQIIDDTPSYTGASKGDKQGPRRDRLKYKSHPAYGMTIGNYFDPGDSGWQFGENKINQYRTQFYITNPMWEHYLKKIEKGVYPSSAGHRFVKNAINKLKERIRSANF